MTNPEKDFHRRQKGSFDMRKTVVLGLIALAIGVFGDAAFAGGVEDCEFLKDKSHPDYAPGLYGLCVAWHNADEDAKNELADKFFDRAGFEVPGSGDVDDPQDFTCRCWSEVTFEDICALGAPLLVKPGRSVRFTDGITFEEYLSPDGSTACRHVIQALPNNEYLLDTLILTLSPEEALDCRAERDIIGTLYLDPNCQ
jgi:hypothetical protein